MKLALVTTSVYRDEDGEEWVSLDAAREALGEYLGPELAGYIPSGKIEGDEHQFVKKEALVDTLRGFLQKEVVAQVNIDAYHAMRHINEGHTFEAESALRCIMAYTSEETRVKVKQLIGALQS